MLFVDQYRCMTFGVIISKLAFCVYLPISLVSFNEVRFTLNQRDKTLKAIQRESNRLIAEGGQILMYIETVSLNEHTWRYTSHDRRKISDDKSYFRTITDFVAQRVYSCELHLYIFILYYKNYLRDKSQIINMSTVEINYFKNTSEVTGF